MASELPEGFGATPFLKFYHGDWAKLLERVQIPDMPDASWDRKAAWLLWECGVPELEEDVYPSHGWNDFLDPNTLAVGGWVEPPKELTKAWPIGGPPHDDGVSSPFNSEGIEPL